MIAFNLTTNDIMTATKDGDIYIRATLFEDDDTDKIVLAVCTRKQWDGLMDTFFARKSDYNKSSNGSFCGVESIYAEGDLMKDKKTYLTRYNSETDAMETENVPSYRITECELEMEHG